MKVVKNTENSLIIEHFPWFVGGIFWTLGLVASISATIGIGYDDLTERALVFVLGYGALILAIVFFPFSRVELNRNEKLVRRCRYYIIGSRILEIPADKIDKFIVDSQRSSSGSNIYMHRAAIKLKTGNIIPLETGFSNRDREKLVGFMNNWLEKLES